MESWGEVTLEGAAGIFILVIAYKVYKMRINTSSECCGGAIQVQSSNPGGNTPRALREITEEKSELTVRDIELGLTNEDIRAMKKARLTRTENSAS
tara:strand:+ start:2597 stop:2884 length:288 start_codon:yes stop_codon:yes gene_type:complete